MNLTSNELTVAALFALVGSYLAVKSDARWVRWIRRRWNRTRTWSNYRRGRSMAPLPPNVCERANTEYRIDRPTRSIP